MDRFRSVRLSRAIMAFCLMMSVAAARTQDTEPLTESDITTDRASASLPGKKTRLLPGTEKVTPARREVSRWERFRDSVWPFRAKRVSESGSREEKRRSLLGDKVRVRAGEGAEFTEFSPMAADSSVSRTRHDVAQEPPPVTAPSVGSSAAGRRDFPIPCQAGLTPAMQYPRSIPYRLPHPSNRECTT